MKVAASILMAGMLLFGVVTFVLILQNSEAAEHWGVLLLMLLSISCGTAIYALYNKLSQENSTIKNKLQELMSVVSPSSKNAESEILNHAQTSESTSSMQQIDDFVEQLDNLTKDSDKALSLLSQIIPISHGLIYLKDSDQDDTYIPTGKYAFYSERTPEPFLLGEGINGQAAKDKTSLLMSDLPDEYVSIVSGLGNTKPRYLALNPIVVNEQTAGLCELGFLSPPTEQELNIVKLYCNKLADKVSTN